MKRPMTDPLDEGFNEEPADAYLKRVQAAFEPGGALTGATEHFARREGQLKFALDVAARTSLRLERVPVRPLPI